MAWDTGPGSQPRGAAEAKNIASEAMGGKSKPRAPRFHRMSITAAENGVSVEHTVKKFSKGEKTRGGNDTAVNPSPSGPWGDRTWEESKTHVLNSDHPMMAHINALHEHFGGSSDSDDDGD